MESLPIQTNKANKRHLELSAFLSECKGTVGEFLFEKFCEDTNWQQKKIDGDINENSSDYLVETSNGIFLAECTDIVGQNFENQKSYSFTIGDSVRRKIKEKQKTKQIKKSQEKYNLPTLLVLYDTKRMGRDGYESISAAMLGDYTMLINKKENKVEDTFFGGNSEIQENKNTSISAIGSLNTPNPESITLDIHYNPFAKIPFSESFFSYKNISKTIYQISEETK